MNSRNHLLLLFFKFILMHIDGQCVDSGRNMLKADALIFKYLQDFPSEANFTVHHGFFNINRAETFLSRNPCDGVFGLSAGALHDKGSLILRVVRIADVDGDYFFSDRENSLLMKNRRYHIR